MYRGHHNAKYKTECTLSYDDASVFCGSEDGRVMMWDLVDSDEGPTVSRGKEHTGVVGSLDNHPQENFLVSAAHDGSIVLWQY